MDGLWARQYQKDEQGETVLDEEGNPVVDREKWNRYQYNGKELTEDLGLNWNDYGARWYDAAVGRWNAVDPLAEKYHPWSAYAYVLGNPTKFIDPDGKRVSLFDKMEASGAYHGPGPEDGEYERNENGNWVKVSEVGDEIGVNFYHEDLMGQNGSVQKTKVEDAEGNVNYINDGRKWLAGGVVRDESVNWWQIYTEWRWGKGPQNSIFIGDHPNNTLIQKSNWLQKKLQAFNASGALRIMEALDWDSGIRQGLKNGRNQNWQLRMMGSFNANFYKMGSKNLVLIIDDKTRESGLGHLPFIKDFSRTEGMPYPAPWSKTRSKYMTTTQQRYLFFVPRE